MALFWAKFKEKNEQLFRFDTRIYLNETKVISEDDNCIGAIVGKNPGSATTNKKKNNTLVEIDLNGDKLLPTVRNILLKSGAKSSANDFIQVLNLFYLCNSDLGEAIKSQKQMDNPEFCVQEQLEFPWIWFVWGGKDKDLDSFKTRFKSIKSKRKFYFDKHLNKVVETIPLNDVLAKHTQGLKHSRIIPFFQQLLIG